SNPTSRPPAARTTTIATRLVRTGGLPFPRRGDRSRFREGLLTLRKPAATHHVVRHSATVGARRGGLRRRLRPDAKRSFTCGTGSHDGSRHCCSCSRSRRSG